MNFVSAYDQLQTAERGFVDAFIQAVERDNAEKPLERLIVTLERVSAKLDMASLDSRTKDMFAKPLVVAAIRERCERLSEERDLLAIRIIKEHRDIAFSNMEDYWTIGEDGFPSPDLTSITREQWAAVAEIDVIDETGKFGSKRRIKFKLHDKQKSLDTLAKWNGLTVADSPENVAYRTLPSDVSRVASTASIEQLSDAYSRMING